jgi:hypothetical protein
MIPSLTLNKKAVQPELQPFGLFKYFWKRFFIPSLRRAKKCKSLFGGFLFGDGRKKFEFCADISYCYSLR